LPRDTTHGQKIVQLQFKINSPLTAQGVNPSSLGPAAGCLLDIFAGASIFSFSISLPFLSKNK
jgi:hypothetical protein